MAKMANITELAKLAKLAKFQIYFQIPEPDAGHHQPTLVLYFPIYNHIDTTSIYIYIHHLDIVPLLTASITY
jgi:hypothetical protein